MPIISVTKVEKSTYFKEEELSLEDLSKVGINVIPGKDSMAVWKLLGDKVLKLSNIKTQREQIPVLNQHDLLPEKRFLLVESEGGKRKVLGPSVVSSSYGLIYDKLRKDNLINIFGNELKLDTDFWVCENSRGEKYLYVQDRLVLGLSQIKRRVDLLLDPQRPWRPLAFYRSDEPDLLIFFGNGKSEEAPFKQTHIDKLALSVINA